MTKPNMTSNALAKTNDNGHFGFFYNRSHQPFLVTSVIILKSFHYEPLWT